jgi:hypothetical protein
LSNLNRPVSPLLFVPLSDDDNNNNPQPGNVYANFLFFLSLILKGEETLWMSFRLSYCKFPSNFSKI